MSFKKRDRKKQDYDSPESMFHDLRNRKVEGLLSHQGDILKKYMQSFNSADIAIELPTGSGKTLVGLLIAEYRRRTKEERTLYLCPTKQLVNQVVEQAVERYGINAISFTGSSHDYDNKDKTDYRSSDAIAVATYSALFNINPFFDNVQAIILDDSHASENYIGSTWSINIIRSENENLYTGIISVFKDFFDSTKFEKLLSGISEFSDLSWVEKIPTKEILNKLPDLTSVIEENILDTNLKFPWQFLQGKLYACQIYLSYDSILIRPYIPPSMTHAPFANATQRIYMSATLGAGGDLERITGVEKITRIPIPDGWDKQGIGRRYFLFPESSLPKEEHPDFIIKLIKLAKRALILVPSNSKAEEIGTIIHDSLGWTTMNASEIEESKSNFTSKDKAVAILANRYDGIDMAGDECRLLFVIGLPKAINLQERFMLSKMACGLVLDDRIRTRIIQAIGRCTRSPTDYAAVVMIGDDLQDWFIFKEKQKLFHPELQGEIIFGFEQSKEVEIDELIKKFNIFLEHGKEWQEADLDILSFRDDAKKESIQEEQKLFKAASKEVKFMYALWNQDFEKACEIAQNIASIYSGGKNIQGVRALWNYFAGSAALLASNEFNKKQYEELSNTLFIKAAAGAGSVGWLRKLANTESIMKESKKDKYDLMLDSNIERLDSLFDTNKYSNPQKFESDVKSVLDGINQDEHKPFENSHKMLGDLLGFISVNPKGDGEPDPYWVVNDELCIVFEDKSSANKETPIPLKYTTQVSTQHPMWIKNNVVLKDKAIIIPVLVSPQTTISKDAVIHAGSTRYWNIDKFRDWTKNAIVILRDLRAQYHGHGDLAWRAEAIQEFSKAGLCPKGIIETLDMCHLKNLIQK